MARQKVNTSLQLSTGTTTTNEPNKIPITDGNGQLPVGTQIRGLLMGMLFGG